MATFGRFLKGVVIGFCIAELSVFAWAARKYYQG